MYVGQEQQLELNVGQQTGSKVEKEYIKPVYCHAAYLTYMQTAAAAAAAKSLQSCRLCVTP